MNPNFHLDYTLNLPNVLLVGIPLLMFLARIGPRFKVLEDWRTKEEEREEKAALVNITFVTSVATLATNVNTIANRLERMETRIDRIVETH